MSSGSRNPLQYHELYRYVRAYFEAHPLPERGRGEHKVPEWSFPGSLSVERMIDRADKLTDVAEKIVTHMPKSKRMRDLVSRVDRDKARVEFVKRYSDLYGAYTEAEVIYTDDRMLALSDSLTPEDRERFPFDSAIMDWRYYLQDVHSPAVTQSLRELSRRERQTPAVKIREREQPVVALFDMEGTIITSNVVESYVWTRMADLPPDEWPRELVSVFGKIPSYLQIDRRDRGDFLRTFFRRYEGASVEGVQRLIDHHVGRVHAPEGQLRRDPPHPRTPRGRSPDDPHHGGRGDLRPAAGAAVRHRDRVRARGARRPIHRVHGLAAARRRGARRVAASLRGAGRHRPEAVVRVRRLVLRPPAPASRRQPRGRLSRLRALSIRAPTALADRAVGDVEGHAARPLPEAGGPMRSRHATAVMCLMALALELFRSAPRYLAARAVGTKAPGLVAGPLAPLRLANRSDPQPRDEHWTRVKPALAGICGSDLSTLAGKSSFYFSPLVSLPFVPGHEVVGEVLDDVDGLVRRRPRRALERPELRDARAGPVPELPGRRVQPM